MHIFNLLRLLVSFIFEGMCIYVELFCHIELVTRSFFRQGQVWKDFVSYTIAVI